MVVPQTRVQATGCCPRFDPEPWDDKQITMQDRLFVRERVHSLFHVPLDFGPVMKRAMTAIEAAGARDPENLVLADQTSPWHTDLLIAVRGPVPGLSLERRSGTFYAKAFEGPYSQSRRWCVTMRECLAAQGRSARKLYTWYTTCPRCAKVYGRNDVVLLAELE